MKRVKVALAAAVFSMGMFGVGSAQAADVADDQGFCKKQGPSSCAGQSECSQGHIADLPRGQAKRC